MTMCSAYTNHAIHLYAKRVTRIECLERWMKVFFPVCFLLGFRVLPPCLGRKCKRYVRRIGISFSGALVELTLYGWFSAWQRHLNVCTVLFSTHSCVPKTCILCFARYGMVWYGIAFNAQFCFGNLSSVWFGTVFDAQFCFGNVSSMYGMVRCSTLRFTPRTNPQFMVWYGERRSVLCRQRIFNAWYGMLFDVQFYTENNSMYGICRGFRRSDLYRQRILHIWHTSRVLTFNFVPAACPQRMARYGFRRSVSCR